jgi:hypothetical protein
MKARAWGLTEILIRVVSLKRLAATMNDNRVTRADGQPALLSNRLEFPSMDRTLDGYIWLRRRVPVIVNAVVIDYFTAGPEVDALQIVLRGLRVEWTGLFRKGAAEGD